MLMRAQHSVPRLMTTLTAILCLLIAMPAMAKSKSKEKKSKDKTVKIDAKTKKFEIQIMEKLIDRHARALKIALAADTATTRPEILAFNPVFEAREQDEMTSLTTWLKTWYNITYTPKPNPEFDAELIDAAAEGGVAFDLMYVDMLIGYENQEVAYAKQLLKQAKHPELLALANAIIATNKVEVKQLKAWEKLWEESVVDEEEED